MIDEILEILLVEDNQAHIELIRRGFMSEGEKFNLTVAGTLAEAGKIMQQSSPDLLFVDYKLPDGKGTSLLPGAANKLTFPVAILTSHGNEKVATAAMKAGAIDYIVKSKITFSDMPHIARRILREWQNIAKRRQVEEEVRKLSSAIMQAGESIVITDSQGIIEYVNPAFTKLTGYSAGEAIGQTPRILKSGNQDAAFYEAMWETITSGKVWHGKVVDRKKDGSFYPSMLTISPVFDASGNVTHYTGFVGLQSDLTELENLEQQFHQAQKMEAIGTLVSGIAHDFNNILAGITGNLYLAKKDVLTQLDVVQKLTNVEQLSMRAADMIQQLLTFARKDRVSIKAIPFTPFIKETLKLLAASVPENIAMHHDICTDALQVKGDSTLLHQVLMNLINNARDAVETEDFPRISVKLEAFHADEIFAKKRTGMMTGSYAHLSVQDNGCGIPEKFREHLFEPFFTTKEQGKGTGLGLSMVFGAIKTHQGLVEVESKEREGATFHIYLPLLERTEANAPAISHEAVPEQGRGEMILFADDQEHVLETGKEVLESFGYQVLTATDGQQAVDVFEAHADEIDLCIFDVIMPVMDGSRAAELIRRTRPDIKIIFSTGYDKLNRSDMAHETVISKPFPIEEMSRLIRQQLDVLKPSALS